MPGAQISPRALTAVALGTATDLPRFMVLEGAAGVGKSVLLASAALASEESGSLVLRARGNARESDFPFGVVRQVFEMPLDTASAPERRAWLRGAARIVPRVLRLDASRPAGTGAGQRCHVESHALFWLTANMARRRPLVIVVDDLQWADAASLRWLVHLSRRMEGLPVAVLAGLSGGEPVAEAELVTELLSGVRRLPLAGLNAGFVSGPVTVRPAVPPVAGLAGAHRLAGALLESGLVAEAAAVLSDAIGRLHLADGLRSAPTLPRERGDGIVASQPELYCQPEIPRTAQQVRGVPGRMAFGTAALTAHERRLIVMAVEGKTNDEIAEHFKVTRRAVEFHFTHIYRKLGIAGRSQLYRFTTSLVA